MYLYIVFFWKTSRDLASSAISWRSILFFSVCKSNHFVSYVLVELRIFCFFLILEKSLKEKLYFFQKKKDQTKILRGFERKNKTPNWLLNKYRFQIKIPTSFNSFLRVLLCIFSSSFKFFKWVTSISCKLLFSSRFAFMS